MVNELLNNPITTFQYFTDGTVSQILNHFVADGQEPWECLELEVLVAIATASISLVALRTELIGKLA